MILVKAQGRFSRLTTLLSIGKSQLPPLLLHHIRFHIPLLLLLHRFHFKQAFLLTFCRFELPSDLNLTVICSVCVMKQPISHFLAESLLIDD